MIPLRGRTRYPSRISSHTHITHDSKLSILAATQPIATNDMANQAVEPVDSADHSSPIVPRYGSMQKRRYPSSLSPMAGGESVLRSGSKKRCLFGLWLKLSASLSRRIRYTQMLGIKARRMG